MATTIVGLEITEEEVRAAEVTTGKNAKVISHGSVRLPVGAARDSEVLDRTAVVLALQELWKKAGFKSKRVVLGLCSRRVLVRDFRTQAMDPDMLKQALPFQVADLLPVPVDQAVIDFYPVSQEGQEVTGLLVAAVADTVTEIVETVTQAKLKVEQVDLAPFGLLRAISMLTKADETVAVVHLGPHTGYVVIADQGVPRFVRIIPLELSEAAPPVETEVSLSDLQQQQADSGEVDTPTMRLFEHSPAPQPVPQQRIDDLVAQIMNTIRFHVDRSGKRIDRILLTGAGAGIPGVHATFTSRITAPVQVVGGHHIAPSEVKSRHGQEDLELLTPVGLAMSGGQA